MPQGELHDRSTGSLPTAEQPGQYGDDSGDFEGIPMRLIRTVAAVGLLAAAATVTPTVRVGHAQTVSPLCFDLNLNNPLRRTASTRWV